MVHKQKKRGLLYLLLVPRIEALALPNLSRTSNAEAHADMYTNQIPYLQQGTIMAV